MQHLILLIFFAGLILTSETSYAYLDPGTGSIILQAIIASILGAMVVLKMFWARVVHFFQSLFHRNHRNP